MGAGALSTAIVRAPVPRRRAEGNAFVLPAAGLLLLLTLFPFLFTLALTFSRVSLVGGLNLSFAGLGNWHRLLTDSRFWTSLGNTVVIVVGAVSLEVLLGFGLALLLYRPLRGGAFFRVLFIVPMALTPIAVGYMWRMLLNETIGPFNALLQAAGLPPLGWVSGDALPLLSMILVDTWQWTPFVFVLCLAGLQALPEELWEAAQLDGASGGQILRYLILPLMVPTLLTASFLRAVEAFKIVDVIFIITGGGPGTRTESLTLHAYYRGLHAFDLAYGATIAFALFLLVLLSSLVFLRLTRRLRATEVWA
ncbi:MAG: sugar ABC transporter permease [Armatimonadota bacterium]|nr:sugar ABC transporter permease [Armatimonadota bacterium]